MDTYSLIPRYILLVLYILTGSLSNYDAIDILAPQWLYLGSVNILTAIYLLISKDDIKTGFNGLFKTAYFWIYLFYIIWSGLSFIYAINEVETFLNIPRLGNVFFAILFCYLLISPLPNKFFFISRLFLFFLIIELAAFYKIFLDIFPDTYSVIQLKGVAGNKNITAASIAFKVPFLIYLFSTFKEVFSKVLIVPVIIGSILAISLIDARAAILSSLIVFISILLFFVYLIVTKFLTPSKGYPLLATVIFTYLAAVLLNISITNTINKTTVNDAIGRIAFTEESSNGRFQYWSHAFEQIKDHPIISCGLGNWKIASISYGKDFITGYTVPYHAHNDFIHVFAETGVPGGLAYILLFLFLGLYIIIMMYRSFKLKNKLFFGYFFLLLPFIVYGIDAGLNFPVARPLMQSSLAILAGLILALYVYQKKPKENKPTKEDTSKNNSILKQRLFIALSLVLLIPGVIIHYISFKSLQQQGRLLHEFNTGRYSYSLPELDQIQDEIPNITETAMPIKAMKARYYFRKEQIDKAIKYAKEGAKDNPTIYFPESLLAQIYLSQGNLAEAYKYSKAAFENLPKNLPHYDIHMQTLTALRKLDEVYTTFEKANSLTPNDKTIWVIFIRALSHLVTLGDAKATQVVTDAYNLFPDDSGILTYYKYFSYGQQRVVEAEKLVKQANESYTAKDYETAASLYQKAFELDPLELAYSLNTGLSLFQTKDFEKAIQYLNISKSSRRVEVKEGSIRFIALSLYNLGRRDEACAQFLQLTQLSPKRMMYRQEFQKYCRN